MGHVTNNQNGGGKQTGSKPPPRRREEPGHSTAKRVRVPNSIYSQLLPIQLITTTESRLTGSTFISKLFPFLRPHQNNSLNLNIIGTYELLSNSVWITKGSMLLWQRGFFGKGSLSRSEPTWLQRAKNQKLLENLENPSYLKLTPEELTAKRRIERKESKIQKSKIKQLAVTANINQISTELNSEKSKDLIITINENKQDSIELTSVQDIITIKEKFNREPISDEIQSQVESIIDLEHLQLMNEEAFFLTFCLGALDVKMEEEPNSVSLSILEMWKLFCLNSIKEKRDKTITPENPFILSYLVYHHFRSLGWVVRSGIKFCTDWVLYGSKGPVGGHAEFAVCMIPVFADGIPIQLIEDRTSWRWLATVNRVCSGVKKTLILVHVIVPTDIDCDEMLSPSILTKYIIKEIVIKRFIPARMRD